MWEVRRVIDRKQFPSSLPVSLTVSSMVALDYWNVPTLLCIVIYVVLAWFWGGAIRRLFTDVPIKILWQPKDFERPESKIEPKVSFSQKKEMTRLVEKEAKDKSKLL